MVSQSADSHVYTSEIFARGQHRCVSPNGSQSSDMKDVYVANRLQT